MARTGTVRAIFAPVASTIFIAQAKRLPIDLIS